MSDLSFKVATRRREKITFDLQGSERVYSFDPPKQADAVLPVMTANGGSDEITATRAAFDWLEKGLSKEDAQHLEDRLRDPEDDLDFDAVLEVTNALMARAAGRPTSSRSGSSGSPRSTG